MLKVNWILIQKFLKVFDEIYGRKYFERNCRFHNRVTAIKIIRNFFRKNSSKKIAIISSAFFMLSALDFTSSENENQMYTFRKSFQKYIFSSSWKFWVHVIGSAKFQRRTCLMQWTWWNCKWYVPIIVKYSCCNFNSIQLFLQRSYA